MESSNTLCQCWSINRQRKMSHCRTRNHLWKLSHGWRVESTANTNSRLTSEIIRENRVIVDAWNREWKLRLYRPEIVSENRVTVDLEIATEIWVTADVWSRQLQRIHERRIKPIAKIDSCLRHGIVKHTMSHSRTRNHLWKLSHGWWMESTARSNSRLTSEINIENRVIVDAWNRQWKLCHNRPEIISEKRVTVELEIATQVWVTANFWSRQRQRIHERRIKPIAKIDSCLTLGIVKHTMSHSRTRNHLWKLSHGWWMKSTAHTNSRLTNEINRENRVIVDAWNRQWKLCHNQPEIISEKRVTVDLEIATKVRLTADVWSRQLQRIHERRIKPIAKIDSCLTHGIVKHTMLVLIHKSSAKTESL